MDIFNKPPSISEDTLQYLLYPLNGLTDKIAITSLAALIVSHVNSLLIPEFIWHRDAFELKVAQDDDRVDSWHMKGHMRVGDSVDDEWCAVWLLREVSKKWNVAIR